MRTARTQTTEQLAYPRLHRRVMSTHIRLETLRRRMLTSNAPTVEFLFTAARSTGWIITRHTLRSAIL